jgi:hypothetical protein
MVLLNMTVIHLLVISRDIGLLKNLGILTIPDGAVIHRPMQDGSANSDQKQRLPQSDARFEQQLANSQKAFEQPVLNSVASYKQQKDTREGVQLLNSRGAGSEQQVAANSWGSGSEQLLGKNSWERESEQQVATNSWGTGSEQQAAANSWGSGSEQRQATNSWEAGSEQRLATNSWARESEQRAVVENSKAEVSEQRAVPNSRPGYELVETVEATHDLAEQLSSLCARFCGYRRRWLPGRPRSAARRPANQRMVIRKENQKYHMHRG